MGNLNPRELARVVGKAGKAIRLPVDIPTAKKLRRLVRAALETGSSVEEMIHAR